MFSLFKKKNTNNNQPNYWTNYLTLCKEKEKFNNLIFDAEFVVLDVESTGLDYKEDKILSIGAVKTKRNQIVVPDSFELYLNQEDYNSDAAPIHGILKDGNVEKYSEKEAIKELIEYLGNRIIIGHSISFDISIINESLKRQFSGKLLNKSIDTVELYKRVKGGDYKAGHSVGLDKLTEEFNIPQSDRHNAAGDALITAILFLKLASRLKKRGVVNLSDLVRKKKWFL